jgi:Tfp pilus assembly protein PilF
MDRIEKLREYLQTSPDDNFLRHALALEYVKIGEDQEARKLFEAILNMDENYIGSYYHLCRLLERNDLREEAIVWYEKGMLKAKEAGDQHAYNELLAAYEDLTD